MTALIHPKEFSGGVPHTLGTFWRLRWSVKNPPADPDVSFAGRTVLVVGANSGLGFESAVKYAQKGAAKLILGVRSAPKGEEAKKEIVQRTGMDAQNITISIVDLNSFSSVQSFVSTLKKNTPCLDVVLLNAGGVWPKYAKSPEGYETTLQVMVLSTTLLAILLLPLLRKNISDNGRPSHLTFVSSEGHTWVKREDYTGSLFEAANDEKQFSPFKNYTLDKFLGMIAMKHIATATTSPDGTPGVIVNACCPSSTQSSMGKDFPKWFHWLVAPVVYFIARSTEQGSRTLVGATALDQSSHGRFWHHDWLYPTNKLLEDKAVMDEYWQDIVKVLETTQPNLKDILRG